MLLVNPFPWAAETLMSECKLPWMARLARALEEAPVEESARRSGFCRRRARKVDPWLFLKSLCLLATIKRPALSMAAALAGILGGRWVSRQGLWKRIGPASAAWMRDLTHGLLTVKSRARTLAGQGHFRSFARVLIHDSTVVPLAPRLANAYPGSANQASKRRAAAKIQVCYDLLGAAFVHFGTSGFTRNDQRASADIVPFARKGDLVLLGRVERPQVRLVAVPVSGRLAAERRRRLLRNRDRRLHPTREQLALCAWTLMITNVPPQIWDSQTVGKVYAVRWSIEIIFKAWKSHFSMTQMPAASAAYVETLLWARLLVITLFTCSVYAPFGLPDSIHSRPLSPLKAARLFALLLPHLWFPHPRPGESLLHDLLFRLGSYDKRNRPALFCSFALPS
jgi:hypothetical protein